MAAAALGRRGEFTSEPEYSEGRRLGGEGRRSGLAGDEWPYPLCSRRSVICDRPRSIGPWTANLRHPFRAEVQSRKNVVGLSCRNRREAHRLRDNLSRGEFWRAGQMKVQVNGAVIKELRVKHSYTQERLAEIVGERRRSLTFEFLSRRIAA